MLCRSDLTNIMPLPKIHGAMCPDERSVMSQTLWRYNDRLMTHLAHKIDLSAEKMQRRIHQRQASSHDDFMIFKAEIEARVNYNRKCIKAMHEAYIPIRYDVSMRELRSAYARIELARKLIADIV